MQHYIVQHNQCLYHSWYKHWLCTPHTWSSVWGAAWLHACCVITVCMHEGASICQTLSYDIYIQGISHACRSVIIIISGKLYYHIPGISGMLASVHVCVSTLSSNSYNYSLNQPAIFCTKCRLGLSYTQARTATCFHSGQQHAAYECPCSPSMQFVVRCFSRADILTSRLLPGLFSTQYQNVYVRIHRVIIRKAE